MAVFVDASHLLFFLLFTKLPFLLVQNNNSSFSDTEEVQAHIECFILQPWRRDGGQNIMLASMLEENSISIRRSSTHTLEVISISLFCFKHETVPGLQNSCQGKQQGKRKTWRKKRFNKNKQMSNNSAMCCCCSSN